jgi:hypothetical protein
MESFVGEVMIRGVDQGRIKDKGCNDVNGIKPVKILSSYRRIIY